MSTAKKRALLIGAQVAAAITLYFIFSWILEAFVAEELQLGVILAALLAAIGIIVAYVSYTAAHRPGSPARLGVQVSTHKPFHTPFSTSRVLTLAFLGAAIGFVAGAPHIVQQIGELVASIISG